MEGPLKLDKQEMSYGDLKAKIREAQLAKVSIRNLAEYRDYVKTVYSESFAEDPANPIELPEHPESLPGFSPEDFFGKKEKLKDITPRIPTYEELKAIIKKARRDEKATINNAIDYVDWVKENYRKYEEKGIKLPATPNEMAEEMPDWKNDLKDLFGLGEDASDAGVDLYHI